MRRRNLLLAVLLAGCARTPPPPTGSSTSAPAPSRPAAPSSLASPDDGLPDTQAWVDAGHGLRFALARDLAPADPHAAASGKAQGAQMAAAAKALRLSAPAFRRRFVQPMARVFVGPATKGFPLLVLVETKRVATLPTADQLTDAVVDLNPHNLRTASAKTRLGQARALAFTLRKRRTVQGWRMAFGTGQRRVVTVWVLGVDGKAVTRTANLVLHSIARQ